MFTGKIHLTTSPPRDIFIIPSRAFKSLREKAKKLKHSSGIPHHEALDKVARDIGLANWPHLVEAAKITALSEEAYKHGLIFGMDIKDALDHPKKFPDLVIDEIVSSFIESSFRKSRGELTEEDLYFIEELRDEIIYFRYKGKIPQSHEDALEIASQYFFFSPQYLWLKGEWLTPWGKFDYEKDWLEDDL